MKLTGLHLPSSFPEQIGFLRVVREPIAQASDETIASLMAANGRPPKSRAEVDADRLAYVLPEWIGYYVRKGTVLVYDGRYQVPLKPNNVLEQMLADLQAANFHDRPLPIVSDGTDPVMNEPAQILLHHLPSGRTYLEPFDCGKMLLRRKGAHV